MAFGLPADSYNQSQGRLHIKFNSDGCTFSFPPSSSWQRKALSLSTARTNSSESSDACMMSWEVNKLYSIGYNIMDAFINYE